ncbi:MAG: M15 family metallopeptidase [Bacteroidaceae bacterium]|nr:M15 family metallopeptidase [Bacteroidaceae bacterium]
MHALSVLLKPRTAPRWPLLKFRTAPRWHFLFLLFCLLPGALFSQKVVADNYPSPETSFVATPVPDSIWNRMQGRSYRKNPHILREDLRYLQLLHVDLQGNVRQGQMICNRAIADDLTEIFRSLYEARYPIERIQLADDFEANDERQMQANNTSCFCYRVVSGSKKLSAHARGLAVDINPLYNPCVRRRTDGSVLVQPSNARTYVNRSTSFPCKITTEDLAYRLFISHGFEWGGAWRSLKDYQHFEKKMAGRR